MEREKKNPYVTKVELDASERRLGDRIIEVDNKHTENYSNLSRLFAVTEKANENIVEGNRLLRESIDNLSHELKEERDYNRKNHSDIVDRVGSHERELFVHNEYIKEQKKVSDTKKNQLLKWVGALSAVFVAILAGIFGVVEVLIPYLLGGE